MIFSTNIVYFSLNKTFKITCSSEHEIVLFSKDVIDILADIFTSLEKIMKTNTVTKANTGEFRAAKSERVRAHFRFVSSVFFSELVSEK